MAESTAPLFLWPYLPGTLAVLQPPKVTKKSPVGFQVQTNGTLISMAVARELKALRVALGVSLDGPPAVNDLFRPFARGAVVVHGC